MVLFEVEIAFFSLFKKQLGAALKFKIRLQLLELQNFQRLKLKIALFR